MKTKFIYKLYVFIAGLFSVWSCSDDNNLVDTKPVAAFSVETAEIELGTTLIFTDASFDLNGDIEVWNWNFGNGETASEPSPTFTFNTIGEYSVTLTVTDNNGNTNTNNFSKIISVLEPSTETKNPPIAWTFALPGKVEDSSPAVDDNGNVYIGTSTKEGVPNVFAIDNNGQVLWSYETGDIVRSAPAIHSNGNIYLGSYDDNLYGFTPAGNIAMQLDIGNNAKYSGPVFGLNGEIYIGSQTDELIAVDEGGNELWRFDTGGDVNSTPAIGSDGRIYVGSTGDFFYAFNTDGTENWSSEFGSWTATATAIAPDGTIYFAGEGNNTDASFGGVLIAYNPDGTEQWRVGLTDKVNQGGPCVAPDGKIYVGGHGNELMAFSQSGSLLWSYPTNGNILSTPAIDNDGNIYLGDDEGYFYVVDPEGNRKWKETKLGVKIWNSPAIGSNGKIYIAADQDNDTAILYALATNATGLADGGWPMRSKNAKHTGR
ncbi:outer membrane protein assembly factor BamB family protein [Flavivirga jejuensis]|uniref:PQQ-binding-like beta-propeller repeat protein n=1 Tax=Flavivirga jejuensis TaxID=870487 RepID=A0ABT8WK68_9FLAO|nr:PQQ-binding-like beta-propeller repeat protein [Flavivirga jejuensis]MDO5973508.1 PQQ-binding-like beta-propeller repeat protein [Flavivirga jejuensis]